MSENSKIEWTDHTFNPWIGCTKVSPACDHCYAEGWARRSGLVSWGPHQRRRTSASYWQQPLRWNARAAEDGVRARVFCASLADVFDNDRAITSGWRGDLWSLIERTPHLDWLLLTKRPQNIGKMLPESYGCSAWGKGWPNVWLGTTAENQEEANRRIQHLLSIPAVIHFVSAEPLLGPIDFQKIKTHDEQRDGINASRFALNKVPEIGFTGLDWIIVGGESGPGARPMQTEWAEAIKRQCNDAGTAFFMKQMWGPTKSKMPAIPERLMVRQFPGATT